MKLNERRFVILLDVRTEGVAPPFSGAGLRASITTVGSDLPINEAEATAAPAAVALRKKPRREAVGCVSLMDVSSECPMAMNLFA